MRNNEFSKVSARNSGNMNRYIFKIEAEPKAEIYVTVPAETQSVARRVLGKILKASSERVYGSGSVGPDFLDADFVFKPRRLQLDEAAITSVEEIDTEDLEEARRYLESEGYNYQGDEERMGSDEKPMFIKNLWTEDERGVYAHLRVWASYDLNIARHNFHVEAILYPTGRFDFETDDAAYAVQFKDKQFSITVEDLPRALFHYEEKFTELIMLLRRADTIAV